VGSLPRAIAGLWQRLLSRQRRRRHDRKGAALQGARLGPAHIDVDHDIDVAAERKFQDYNVYWLEEPVVPDDFAGYLRIAEALDLRVVGGETHFTRFDLKPFFENPRLPILQPDPMRGGLTELRKIATVADTWGMTIAPHLFPELNIQLLASISNGLWIEDMGLAEDLWVDPVPVANGFITAPERPGHGLAFRPEILRDCAVKD
jgi:L-alanine-DL-glutamate epimerase-like enolase superfamily enzyme